VCITAFTINSIHGNDTNRLANYDKMIELDNIIYRKIVIIAADTARQAKQDNMQGTKIQ
jgi:hypothetical protein